MLVRGCAARVTGVQVEGGVAVVRGAAMPIRQYSVVAESTLAASLVAQYTGTYSLYISS